MKQLSLKENYLFSKAYSKGKRAITPSVVVYVLRDLHAGLLKKAHPQKIVQNRLGLTVTKKMGGAVERSRIKRRLRAAYAEVGKQCEVKKGYLVVLVARTATKDISFETLCKNMKDAFKKVGLVQAEA